MATYRLAITAGTPEVSVMADSLLRHFQSWMVPLVSVTWTPAEYLITTGADLTNEQMQHLGLEAA